MLWEISLLIIGIAILLLVVFAIPSLVQLRKTAKSIELTSKTMNQNLPGILTNLDEITTNITGSTQVVHSQLENLSVAVEKIQEMVDNVVDFEKTLRYEVEGPIVETIGTFSAVIRGIQAFLVAIRGR